MSKRRLLPPCLLVVSALAFMACGSEGSDSEGEIREVIETAATSTDPADCKKLTTLRFMEQTTHESGAEAVKDCEEDAEAEEVVDSVRVFAVKVDGSSATAEAALSGGDLNGQTLEFALIKDEDGWKMDEVVEFTEFDRGKLVEALEEILSERSSEIPPQLGSCLIDVFARGTQVEAEELLFGKSSDLFEEMLEACASRASA